MLQIEKSGSPIQAHGSPLNVLRIPCAGKWRANGTIEFISIDYSAGVYDRQAAWPTMRQPVGRLAGPHHGAADFDILLPWDRPFVDWIEGKRQGGGPVVITINTTACYRELVPRDLDRGAPSMVSHIESNHPYRVSVEIDRDTWLSLLTSMGWDEFRVFEIPVRGFKRDARFERALQHLAAAQTAFRQGQWDTAITDARRACEAAVAVADSDALQKKNTQQGFDKLFRLVLPDDGDEVKREALDKICRGIGTVRQEAAHGRDLEIQFRRHDAELILTAAISVFRYIGEELSRRERRG